MKVTEKKFLNLHQTLSPIATVNGKHGIHHQNNNTISPTDSTLQQQLHVAVSVPQAAEQLVAAAPVTSIGGVLGAAAAAPVTSAPTNGHHSIVADDQCQNKVRLCHFLNPYTTSKK